MWDRNVPAESGIAWSQNAVYTAINKFRNHPSILSINKNMERIRCPSFAFEKCIIGRNKTVRADIQISNIKVTSESTVRHLRIHISNRLNFGYHVSKLCKKASKKPHALARICKYVETSKSRVLVNSFTSSQFSYCPLKWMFHSRKMEHKINKIHKRALRPIYPSDLKLLFQELLDKNKTATTH